MGGILIVNKHAGVTSHDIVYKIRRLYGTKQVGHTGTLDPMAEGVLVMLVGGAVKASEYLVCHEKRYEAGLQLGIETDTEDVTGEVLRKGEEIPSREAVLSVCQRFVGEGEQIPPMYSALKVGGRKLCDLAREGVEVAREPRPITVFSLKAEATEDEREYRLAVHCSSGTYIRTLCADIGKALGCGATMSSLRRTAVGEFSLDGARTVDELSAMSEEEREALLLPTETLFSSLPELHFPAFYERLCKNGCEIYLKKISRSDLCEGARLRLCDKDGFFALGEVRSYPDGLAVKAIKFFRQ